jgi:hypothetical protein
MEAFNYAQKSVGKRINLGKMSILVRDKKFWDSCELVQNFTKRQINRALHRQNNESNISKPREGISKYNLVKELAKVIKDEETLSGQLLNLFFGGRDTPAVAISNVIFCLARHPRVWENIRKEVGELEPEDLSFEKLKSMRYLQHAINEGLRLYPALPSVSRVCLTDTAIPYGGGPDGSQPVCATVGDTVMWSVFSMHRKPDIFGADVDLYRPERWEEIRPGWNYLPFSGGARHCPAQQLDVLGVICNRSHGDGVRSDEECGSSGGICGELETEHGEPQRSQGVLDPSIMAEGNNVGTKIFSNDTLRLQVVLLPLRS